MEAETLLKKYIAGLSGTWSFRDMDSVSGQNTVRAIDGII